MPPNRGRGSHLPNLHHLFVAYLNQDWSTDGDTLEEIFQNRSELQRMSPELRSEISDLLQPGPTDQELDDLLYGEWLAGYEPDEDEGETWTDVLHQIKDLCGYYSSDDG